MIAPPPKPLAQPDSFVFSTNDLPEKDRFAIWCEAFLRHYMALESESHTDGPYFGRMQFRNYDSIAIGALDGSAGRFTRTRQLITDGEDSFMLLFSRGGDVHVTQHGVEATIGRGGGIVLDSTRPFSVTGRDFVKSWAIKLSRRDLSLLMPDHDDLGGRTIGADNPAARLLMGYLDQAAATATMGDQLSRMFGKHVLDLVALGFGASRDAHETITQGGVRAARLSAVKADVLANIGHPGLTLNVVALRQGISASYIRKLFDSEGTNFTAFVHGLRLQRAHRMLNDLRSAGLKISVIAFEAGFGDLSYFNRTFRRAYGVSPSDMRAEMLRREKDR